MIARTKFAHECNGAPRFIINVHAQHLARKRLQLARYVEVMY